MAAYDPVPWDAVEETVGPPAREVTEYVDELAEEVSGEDPYRAVKTIHDALYETDRTVDSMGEPFITAYLLEQRGVIDADADGEFNSLVGRRPDTARLHELFWERERTLWWIGLVTGVHPSLVTFWLYEDDIPLMERNYREESLEQIRPAMDGHDR